MSTKDIYVEDEGQDQCFNVFAESEQWRKEAAFHEAAHVVAFHLAGFGIENVTIDEDWIDGDDAEGRVTLKEAGLKILCHPIKPRNHCKVEKFGVGICAGIVAQSRVSSTSLDELRMYGGAGDYSKAEDTAMLLTFNVFKVGPMVAKWEARAAALLNDHWSAVEFIANELLNGEYDILTGKVLKNILVRAFETSVIA